MKKENLKAKGFRLYDRQIDHLAKKSKKEGCASDVVRELIDADIEKDQKKK